MKNPSLTETELIRKISALEKRIEELERSERHLSGIIELLPDATFAIDLEGNITAWNKAMEEMTGFSAERMLGKGDYEYAIPFYGEKRPVLADFVFSCGDDVARKYSILKKEGDTLYVESEVPCLLGQKRTLRGKACPLRNDRGDIIGAIQSIRDITERIRAEEEPSKSEETLRAFFDAVHDSVLLVDKEGVIVLVNAIAAQRLSKPVHELVGTSERDLFPPDVARYRREQQDKVVATGEPVHFEDIRSGKYYEHYYYPVFDAERKVSAIAIFARDITERKLSLEALEESEERYRTVVEHSRDGIAIIGEGVHIYVNQRFLDIFGFESAREVLGKPHSVTVHPDDLDRVVNINRKRQDGDVAPSTYEFKGIRKDGSTMFADVSATRIMYKGSYKSLVFLRDVTDRKQAEEALRIAHRRVLDIIEFLPDATFVIDHERKVVAWNKAIEAMTGVKKEDIIGKGNYVYAVPFYGDRRPVLIDMVFEKDEESLKQYDYTEKQGDILLSEVHVPMVHQGRGAYVSARASTLFDPKGNVVGAIESIRDISEQKRITKELQESEERYRTAIESSNDAVAMTKGEEHLYVNRKFLEIFGFEGVHQVLGQPIGLVAHPDDRERVAEINRRRQRHEEVPQQYEFRGIRTNGDVVFIESSATQTAYKGEPITLVYLRDVTARKQLEAQLRQSQKMEAIGTLAGGVAHDFNNILTAIIGYGSLLRAGMSNDPKRQYVDQLLASSQKAAILTQSLLAFSRKQTIALKPRRINEIVGEAEELLRRLLTEDIEFTVTRASPDITVEADATQIYQVLMNFATNARDAMPGGGKLTIETSAVSLDKHFAEVHGFGKPGSYALISVTDTGAGMDQVTREKIFEPFFTTKEVGKGTGLGLSIVYGIIKQHNGYITVSSEPQRGTRFDIYLPVVKTVAERTKQFYEDVKGGNETILIAEDNNDVRRLAKEILTSKGYTVIEAVDGDDGVRQFMQHRDEIDLLLLDVVMPGKNGKEVYRKIRKLKPDVKVLFTSGHTGEVINIKGISDDAIDYIPKPLTPNELLKKVREVLDR